MKYLLELTEDQARTISVACEFYARVRMGQFKEIIWHTLDMETQTDDYCQRRDEAERLLFEARKQLYPELRGIGHSYGIGKFQDADRAFDVHQVIRQKFGDTRSSFSYEELPKCIEVEEVVMDKIREEIGK